MTTSTRDDRVHPYHARSFVKRLLDIQEANQSNDNRSVLYFENIEGGHGGAADNKQQAFMNVSCFGFKICPCCECVTNRCNTVHSSFYVWWW